MYIWEQGFTFGDPRPRRRSRLDPLRDQSSRSPGSSSQRRRSGCTMSTEDPRPAPPAAPAAPNASGLAGARRPPGARARLILAHVGIYVAALIFISPLIYAFFSALKPNAEMFSMPPDAGRLGAAVEQLRRRVRLRTVPDLHHELLHRRDRRNAGRAGRLDHGRICLRASAMEGARRRLRPVPGHAHGAGRGARHPPCSR